MSDYDLDFQKVHASYRARIQRYLTHLIGEHEAEDLTQEFFVKVAKALDSFKGESSLPTWVYRIATHVAVYRMRSLSFQRIDQQKSLDDSTERCFDPAKCLYWLVSSGLVPEADGVEKQTRKQRVGAALNCRGSYLPNDMVQLQSLG